MSRAHKVAPGQAVRLRDIDPAHTHGVARHEADERFAALNAQLAALQEMHDAAGQSAILIVLQGLDTAAGPLSNREELTMTTSPTHTTQPLTERPAWRALGDH